MAAASQPGLTPCLWMSASKPNGDRLPLKELPLVPANQPGETTTTAILPPQATTSRVTITASNLDAGVNLNIRRSPDSASEVLARVPTGWPASRPALSWN